MYIALFDRQCGSSFLQAEEARHLKRMRRREKAEAMRLLDMERRQKLRVEEIRKTQKKVCTFNFFFLSSEYDFVLVSNSFALQIAHFDYIKFTFVSTLGRGKFISERATTG